MQFEYWLDNFWSLTVGGLTQGAIYALVALGYTLVYGVLRLINFAHSEVFMIGTFAVPIAWTAIGYGRDAHPSGLGSVVLLFAVGLIAAALASAATAMLVERVAYRPLRPKNPPSLIFLITAIGASVVLSEAVGLLVKRKPMGAMTLIQPKEVFTIFGTSVDNVQLLVVGAAIGMMLLLDQFINRTRAGRGVRAVAQNPDAAALMGVNRDRIILMIFMLGGIMAGGAALLYMIKVGSTKYDAGFLLGVKAFAAAVLGGIGNLRGALLGGLLLGVVENWGAGLIGDKWIDATAFVVLVVILMFRPTGLLGESLGRARA
ncbi:branched-chain amino acid ABC transporter permease [Longispora albida]|uniref:branched-chain amino acid ABC transporter permease n=1 Tax=Longispora albida TaxID=203523 RepID=UPI00037EABF6|nr:branched-chain amino acid ABC transporter permease [Longispora albida]